MADWVAVAQHDLRRLPQGDRPVDASAELFDVRTQLHNFNPMVTRGTGEELS
jgi:hypothetical protein